MKARVVGHWRTTTGADTEEGAEARCESGRRPAKEQTGDVDADSVCCDRSAGINSPMPWPASLAVESCTFP